MAKNDDVQAVNDWRREAARNEKLSKLLLQVPAVGLPCATLAGYVSHEAAALMLFATVQIVVVGMYMTWVRRHEFADALAEAEGRVASAQRAGHIAPPLAALSHGHASRPSRLCPHTI